MEVLFMQLQSLQVVWLAEFGVSGYWFQLIGIDVGDNVKNAILAAVNWAKLFGGHNDATFIAEMMLKADVGTKPTFLKKFQVPTPVATAPTSVKRSQMRLLLLQLELQATPNYSKTNNEPVFCHS